LETLEELKKWMATLSMAEKRFVKLLGKARAGTAESQQLELFDWLNLRDNRKRSLASAKFMHNLPTVANRLKDLILDSLRLLYKENGIDAQLRTTLDELAILMERRLYHIVGRQVRRCKAEALGHCRYTLALQCIEYELRLVEAMQSSDAIAQLAKLHAEELDITQKVMDLQRVRQLHDYLVARTKQSFPRDPETLCELRALGKNKRLIQLSLEGAYLEQALAVNVLGMKDLCEGEPRLALERYERLLDRWSTQPAWQLDQSKLLLLICSQYQIASFTTAINTAQTAHYLSKLPDFKVLAPAFKLDFERTLYRNQLALSLNKGDFGTVNALVAEIDGWLLQNAADLTGPRVLVFLHNLAIAEFLQGRSAAANRFAHRILNFEDRKAKTDLRHFAQLLQPILQQDLGDQALADYQIRAAKRFFQKQAETKEFELAVLSRVWSTPKKPSLHPPKPKPTRP
jgi:hypothetical protein